MAGPWEDYTPKHAGAAPWEEYAKSKSAGGATGSWAPKEPGYIESAAAGLGSGVGRVAMGAQHYVGKALGALGADTAGRYLVNDAAQGRAKLAGEIAPYKAANPMTAGGGELGGEILSTLPVGGFLGAAAKGLGATRLGASLASGGFHLGGKATATAGGRAADLGLRTLGGAATGGVSAGLVNPDDAGMGALVGGLLPGGVKAAGLAAGGVGRAVSSLRAPAETKLANKLAQSLNMTADELAAAVRQTGPQMIPGYQATVPQILQNPVTSQLQRTLKTAGTNALGDAERVQQSQMRQAIERIAPIDLTVQDAAARAGGSIQAYAIPARARATEKVRAAFEGVDPFNESGLILPIDKMQAASSKYLGAGTFGTGSKASQAVATAREVGQEILPGLKPIHQGAINKGQNLEQAVRAAGGIRGYSGELKDLGIKQSGTTGMINNKSGQSVDLLAEKMHARGFLPDSDPATLLDALRNSAGRKIYADDFADAGFAAQLERSMGDLPGATTISKAVPFETVQNLRSSIGEAAEQASAKGANKEAAALRQMVAEIDDKINRLAGGAVDAGEYFPKDMADQYKKALKLHADKIEKFETGPQIGMFRKGGDGQLSTKGAEIPGKFYNSRRSQVDDLSSLKRLIGDQPALLDDMKRYAVTEAAGTSNAAGDLTSKYNQWLSSRSGANSQLFNAQENATLREVGEAVKRQFAAENMGRVSGSDTAQKLASLNSLGLLDSKMVNILANRIPVVGSFTAPMLASLKETAGKTRNTALAGLLANPDDLVKALKVGTSESEELLRYLNRVGQIGSKVAPAITAQ